VRLVVAAVAAAGLVAAACPAAAADGTADRVGVADARPGWAVGTADRGPADPGTEVTARVYLAGRDPQGLTRFVAAVSDPSSGEYRHFLTPAAYRARFGPTAAQQRAVTSWLRSAGLTVTATTQHFVAVSGDAGAVSKAFGTALHSYADATDGGARHYAPAGRITVPAALSSAVLGVTGLDNGSHRIRPTVVGDADTGTRARTVATPADTLPGPPSVILRAGPCSTYYRQNPATDQPPVHGQTGYWTNCGYTPQQIRSAYGLGSGQTGAGQTVAIVDAYASPTITADVTAFAKNHGTADFRPGQFTQNLPGSWNSVDACYGNSWYVEESLDVTAVHEVAPDANIVYVGAASCNLDDEQDALSRIVDGNLASIVSNSWNRDQESHTSQAERDGMEQVFKQGAAEGIGFYFSSGDCGADDPATSCTVYPDGPGTEFPPSDPYVTAVGGTAMEVGASGHQVAQTGWGNLRSELSADGTGWTPEPGTGYPATFTGGSGGGTSQLYRQPRYQANVVPASLSTTLPNGKPLAQPMRVVPDVSMDADNNTGILVGLTQAYPDGTNRYHETRLGGTSLSVQLLAGMHAVAQQVSGHPIGFANPLLYSRYGTAAYDDVTSGTLAVVRHDYTDISDPTSPQRTRVITMGEAGLLHATTGYDNLTGLGSPSAAYLTALSRGR
jgi:subtilase family serine protease